MLRSMTVALGGTLLLSACGGGDGTTPAPLTDAERLYAAHADSLAANDWVFDLAPDGADDRPVSGSARFDGNMFIAMDWIDSTSQEEATTYIVGSAEALARFADAGDSIDLFASDFAGSIYPDDPILFVPGNLTGTLYASSDSALFRGNMQGTLTYGGEVINFTTYQAGEFVGRGEALLTYPAEEVDPEPQSAFMYQGQPVFHSAYLVMVAR